MCTKVVADGHGSSIMIIGKYILLYIYGMNYTKTVIRNEIA